MSSYMKVTTIIFGISLFGVAGYALYLLYRKDEEDDYNRTIPRSSNYKQLRISVPAGLASALIGRKGIKIKEIEEKSNTRIYCREPTKDDLNSRICIIKGSVEGCQLAHILINDFITNQPKIETEELWVPRKYIMKIIGKEGERIHEIKALSGAVISCNRYSNDTLPTHKGMKCFSIKGTKEQIMLAKSYICDIVEQCQSAQLHLEFSLSKRKPRHPAKISECTRPQHDCKEEKLIQSDQTDSSVEVYVSAMCTPSCFWLQIVGTKATELDQLVENMSAFYQVEENRRLCALENVCPEDLVAALFKYDNKWYRAEVLSVTNDDVQVIFVDYGDNETIHISEVYELKLNFLELHFQAIECCLGRIEPVHGEWSEQAIDKFEELAQVAQWNKLTARVNGYLLRQKVRAKRGNSPVPDVDLYDIKDDQDINVAEEMVKAGHAVFKKEELPAGEIQ